MPDKTLAVAIVILAAVVFIVGAPFALNEYAKWQERTHMNQSMNNLTAVPTTLPPATHQITDGYWCSQYSLFVNNQETSVRDCYQFFPNGSYTQGESSEGYGMMRVSTCQASGSCGFDQWRTNAKGEYEIFLKTFTLHGDTLTCPGCENPYVWYPTGL